MSGINDFWGWGLSVWPLGPQHNPESYIVYYVIVNCSDSAYHNSPWFRLTRNHTGSVPS